MYWWFISFGNEISSRKPSTAESTKRFKVLFMGFILDKWGHSIHRVLILLSPFLIPFGSWAVTLTHPVEWDETQACVRSIQLVVVCLSSAGHSTYTINILLGTKLASLIWGLYLQATSMESPFSIASNLERWCWYETSLNHDLISWFTPKLVSIFLLSCPLIASSAKMQLSSKNSYCQLLSTLDTFPLAF